MKVKSTTNVNCHRKYSPKKVWMYSNCEMPNSAVLLSKVHTYIQRSTFLYSYSFLGVFYTNLGRQFTYPTHCRFLMPDNTQIILTEIWHHFWLKNDDEKWSRKKLSWNSTMAFRVAAAQYKKICLERLNWPGRLTSISEGHRETSKYFFLDHFSSSF